MRKALIGLILAATMMTPVAAEAQRGHGRGGDRGGDAPRTYNENGGGGREGRAARNEARQQQQQQQQAQPQAQPQPQPQQQQVQVAQRRGGGGDGNRNRGGNGGGGNWRGNNGNGGNNNAGANNNGGGNWQGRRNDNNQQSIYPQAWQGNPNDPRLRRYQETERRNQQRYGDGRRGDNDRNWRNDRNDRNWRDGDRDGRRGNWNRGWRNDNRYDWQRWRYSNRNIFRLNPYYSPYRGYGYNRFDIGFFLEPLFYSRNYWIGDPWQYRLPPAYPGTQWVRYYNDVVLVDVYSGEVLDVIYDFFW